MWLDDINTYPYAWTVNFKICVTHSSEHPNLPFRFCLKLRPRLTCTSAAWYVKLKVSPVDSYGISEGWMTEKIPRQKWSISDVWEHFWVQEHRMPIWRGAHCAFETFRWHHHNKNMKIVNISLDVWQFLKLTQIWNSRNHYFYRLPQQATNCSLKQTIIIPC